MKYRFEMWCPRCRKRNSDIVTDKRKPPPRVNCGDCLMNDTQIVEMQVLAVFVTESEATEESDHE